LCVMLEHGADPSTYVEHACKTREHVYWSYTALHAAARKGYTDCVKALLRAGAGASLLDTWTDASMAADQAVRQPCLDLKDVPARSTALMWAVANGHLDTVSGPTTRPSVSRTAATADY
jgi:ankyrin repeat protein